MKILITGSSGQIGTNLALALQREGHEVIGVDIRSNPWTDKIDTIVFDLTFPITSFKITEDLRNLNYKFDCLIHFAANAKVHELVKYPSRAIDNIIMTFNALELSRMHNIPVILSSTREVYGDINRYITEESNADFAYTESPYAASKISSEALVYSYAACYNIKYIVLRFSNVYGRFDNDLERMERVIPLFIKRISDGELVTVFGENKTLDFTYIDDCISGIMNSIRLLVAGKVQNHTFNLAYGKGHTLIETAKLIAHFLNKKITINIEPSRVGEVTRYVANIDKAISLLGYNPMTPLELGIEKSIEWNTEFWAGK